MGPEDKDKETRDKSIVEEEQSVVDKSLTLAEEPSIVEPSILEEQSIVEDEPSIIDKSLTLTQEHKVMDNSFHDLVINEEENQEQKGEKEKGTRTREEDYQ